MSVGATSWGLAALTWMLVLQASAFGRCPPQDDVELVAAGGAIVSGRIIQVGPPIAAGGRDYQWARLEVAERRAGSAPRIVRLRVYDNGLYTLDLAVGTTGTLAIQRPYGESAVSACDTRGR